MGALIFVVIATFCNSLESSFPVANRLLRPACRVVRLRGGSESTAIQPYDSVGKQLESDEIEPGLNATYLKQGEGFMRPGAEDEILVSYVVRSHGEVLREQEVPVWVYLGQGAFPDHVERAIRKRLTRYSTLSIVYNETEEEFEVSLLDWNTVWTSGDGRIAFKSYGQPTNYSPPVGDSDNITVALSEKRVSWWSNVSSSKDAMVSYLRSLDEEREGLKTVSAKVPQTLMSMSPEMLQLMSKTAASLKVQDGFLRSRRRQVTAVLGNEEVQPQELELALHFLRPGQNATLLVAVNHTLEEGKETQVDEGTAILYHIELIRDDSADEVSTEQRLQIALQRKEKGNFYFGQKNYARALTLYGRAMTMIGASADDEHVRNATSNQYAKTELADEVREIEVSLLLNAASCHLRMPKTLMSSEQVSALGGSKDAHPAQRALIAIDRAITLKPNNTKAFLRRSEAHEQLREYHIAMQDVKMAMILQGDVNSTACDKRMGRLKQLARIQDKKDAKVFAKMFEPSKEKPRIKSRSQEEEEHRIEMLETNISATDDAKTSRMKAAQQALPVPPVEPSTFKEAPAEVVPLPPLNTSSRILVNDAEARQVIQQGGWLYEPDNEPRDGCEVR